MATNADMRPNLVDRLFLRLDGLQGPPSLNMYGLTLEGSVNAARLAEAWRLAVAEQPRLASVVRATRWGYDRVPGAGVGPMEFSDDLDPEAAMAFHQRPLDLATQPPVRARLAVSGHKAELHMALHHSVADAMGGYFLLDRVAAHERALAGREPVPPLPTAPSRSYGEVWRALPAGTRFRGALGMARSFGELSAAAPPCAAFLDQPLPARGQLRWIVVDVPPDSATDLKARARAQGATLGDALLAAAAIAGRATWPNPDLPVIAMLPASLRPGAPIDLANRVAELPIVLAQADCDALDRAMAAATRATAAARDRTAAAGRILERAIASHLPPALFRHLVATHLDRPVNRSMTLVFSNLGVMDDMPRDFADARITAVTGLPPLTVPPGLALVPASRGGRLVLTIGYASPAVAEPSVRAFAAAMLGAIRPS